MKELSSSSSLHNPVHFLKAPAKNSQPFFSIFHRTTARKLQGRGNSVPRLQRKPWPKAIISLALAYDFPENIYSQFFNSISPYFLGCVYKLLIIHIFLTPKINKIFLQIPHSTTKKLSFCICNNFTERILQNERQSNIPNPCTCIARRI